VVATEEYLHPFGNRAVRPDAQGRALLPVMHLGQAIAATPDAVTWISLLETHHAALDFRQLADRTLGALLQKTLNPAHAPASLQSFSSGEK